MESSFLNISLILFIVLIISFFFRLLKQPLVIGYILSGIVVGPLFLNLIPKTDTFSFFADLGITFLLFIVGLNLNPRVIKEVGKISFITGVGQVLFTSIIGFFLCLLLGFSHLFSLYVSVALTFSSTIIIMKLLSDKDALDKLYGRISIGFLIVQDIIAMLLLVVISSSSNSAALELIGSTLTKGVTLLVILVSLGYFILPKFQNFFAKSQEFLFLFAVALGLGLASLFYLAGFSIEVGALTAGVLISMSPYSYEVSSRLKPLRDFFIISFFIVLGSQMIIDEVIPLLKPAIILSFFVLLGNPLIVMILMGLLGYSKNTGFMAGLTVAQISEFSLILVALGVKLGHIPSEALSLTTMVGLITIAGSTYMMIYSEKIYSVLSPYLNIFERKNKKSEEAIREEYDSILIGENRIGFSIMKTFMEMKEKYLIIDFNPERVQKLVSEGIPCVYGDASNLEFLSNIGIEKAKLIVSTIPEVETNISILKQVKEKNKSAIVIVTARQISDTFLLYEKGADYVILPHFLGGEYTAEMIKKAKMNKEIYKKEKIKQLLNLKERLKEGQEHPRTEKN